MARIPFRWMVRAPSWIQWDEMQHFSETQMMDEKDTDSPPQVISPA